MFIFNVNLSKKNIKKIILFISVVLSISSIIIFISKKSQSSNKIFVRDNIPAEEFTQIPVANYTSILKDSHENIDKYVRQENKIFRICT